MARGRDAGANVGARSRAQSEGEDMSAIAPDGASAASEPTSAAALSRRRRCNASAGSRSARSNVASTAAAPPRSIRTAAPVSPIDSSPATATFSRNASSGGTRSGGVLRDGSALGDPGLDAEQAVRRLAGGGARPLGVGDAAPRHHPVDSAGQDDLVRAQAIAVLELAAEEVGHCREADMGMRADVDALTRDEVSRSHLVEENERPDHLALRRGKRPANLETADVAWPLHDQSLDRLDGDSVGTNGIQ